MAKYLVQLTYNAEGVQGLIRGGGGSARAAAIRQMLEGSGARQQAVSTVLSEDNFFAVQAVLRQLTKTLHGKLEAFYFAFGEVDVVAIVEVPDHIGVASALLAVNAAGIGRAKATPLLTAEEMDEAVGRYVAYRPPGR